MTSTLSGVTGVLYTGAVIQSARLRRTVLDGVPEEVLLTRETLLQAVREHGPVLTLHQKPSGDWVALETIALLRIEGADYLKCINDGYPCDDLGDLPTGAPS
ncbi:MAG: hypothetical protein Q8M91_01005 [Polaromonas sp.]|nr:hypothetical protein [Polaromonas sp.]MDP3413822.1 hypothetical protein [Polaromonas sp.]MDP3607177.1 hypothetical protein [Polaromonas sp.]